MHRQRRTSADGWGLPGFRWAICLALLMPAGGASVATAWAGDAPEERICVDVRIGDQRSYDCLNSQLRAAVAPLRPVVSEPMNATNIAPPAAGIFNQAATRERLGNAFGRSVVAQRPPPPVYANPLLPRAGR